MNFQYIDNFDFGFLNSDFNLKETVLNVTEISLEKCSNEEKAIET